MSKYIVDEKILIELLKEEYELECFKTIGIDISEADISEQLKKYSKICNREFKNFEDLAIFEISRLKGNIIQEEYPYIVKVGNNSEIHSKSEQDYLNLIKDIQENTY